MTDTTLPPDAAREAAEAAGRELFIAAYALALTGEEDALALAVGHEPAPVLALALVRMALEAASAHREAAELRAAAAGGRGYDPFATWGT